MSAMSPRLSPKVLAAFVALGSLVSADQKKLTDDQHMEILRGLAAEYATCKVPLPRSKKALDVNTDGAYNVPQWAAAAKEFGPAGRVGDMVQVTHVEIDKDSIILEINNGMKSAKGSWKDHIQIGIGGGGGGVNPVGGQQRTNAPSGTTIALRFGAPIGEITSAEIKKMLAPVLDFDKHSATDQYADSIPIEIKQAIEDKKPIEGMDRDQVVMALGKPARKSRETKDGVDYEDWIYGQPPGRMTFVTFSGAKVVKVKETYAGLGGSIAETPKQ